MLEFVVSVKGFLCLMGFSIVYFLVLKPLVPLLYIKLKLGNDAKLLYYPIFGSFRNYTESFKNDNDSYSFHRKIINNNPNTKMILSNILSQPSINFLDPSYSKLIMFNHENYKKLEIIPDYRLLQGGILYSFGQKWREQRKRLSQYFHYDMLKGRLPMINSVVRQKLEQVDSSNYNCLFTNTLITGEIIIRSFFGNEMLGLQFNGGSIQIEMVKLIAQLSILNMQDRYFSTKYQLFGEWAWRILPTRKEREIHQKVTSFIDLCQQCINQRIESRKKKDYQPNVDFLENYLEDLEVEQNQVKKDKLTFQEIISQFITLFFAGTDSTSHLCTVMCYYLAKYPEAQQEILEELTTVVGEGDVLPQHLNLLKKLDAFQNECLRMNNVVPSLLVRQVIKDHQLNDIYLKKGWYVNYSPLAIYSNEKYFDNPYKFDYKRWINEQPVKIQDQAPFIFAPFSAGPRNCIGQHMAQMEIRIILSHIIRKFRFYLNEDLQIKWRLSFLYMFSPQNVVQIVNRQK